ncbi:MFS transporter [Streptomyces sp. NPDC059740]|uniref:MFS transporter n=1 Tax=Streptomyces sp. NPDC059740 TaxID=3346926 RepID=UPI0036687026
MNASQEGAGTALAKPSLFRHRNFLLLWIGETTSGLGNSLATLALPLIAVLNLDTGTLGVSLLGASVWVPWLVLGLPVGAWVDRLPVRPLMIACDLVAAVLFASVPVAWWLDLLSFPYLVVVGMLTGTTSVFFSTAYHVYLPGVLTPEELMAGNATLQGSESAAQVAGPGLAGLISRAFGAVTGLLVNAASFLVSALCLALIRATPVEREAEQEPGTLREQIAEGLRFVTRDGYLRPIVTYGALANVTLAGYEAIQVVYLVRTLGASPLVVGLLVAAGSLGGVLGSLVVGPVVKRFGTARGMLVIQLGAAPFGLLIPLSGAGWGLPLFAVGTMVPIAGTVAANVILNSFRQTYCPPRLLGRVVSSTMVVNFGALPVGAVLGGFLGSAVGLRPTMWIMMVGLVLTGLVLLAGPIGRVRDLPTEPPAPRRSDAEANLAAATGEAGS